MMSHSKSKPFTERICRFTKHDVAKLYQFVFIMNRNLDFDGIEIDVFELAGVEYWLLTVRTGKQSYWIDLRRAQTTGHITIKRPDRRNIRHALAYLGLILNLNELL